MFGLTKREQRWKAEQKAAETIAGVLVAAINAKSHKGEEMNKSEQLIACLEGEIAKRDARIVELERYDEAVERAAFEAWHKERYPAVKIRVQNLLGTYTDMQVECNFETWLACAESHSKRFGGALLDANARLNGPPVSEAKAQGVVMPERQDDQYGDQDAIGWNACLDEVARLNAAPAAPAADAGIVDMYRHLQKVTPYRFKKIQDASITDGGDVMYFHKDRFDAALLADMAAPAAPAADAGYVFYGMDGNHP